MTSEENHTDDAVNDAISPAIERRIKDCYIYNQTIFEIQSFNEKIGKAARKIDTITIKGIVSNGSPTTPKSSYLEALGNEFEKIKFNGANLINYVKDIKEGLVPAPNFPIEMCNNCASKYIRADNFTCKPVAAPTLQRNTGLNSNTYQSHINADD